ncbi:Ff.00g027330.m01.CDS01 [Fusarium sp. VM40]|nr:Ff.00g027330.m01.CDS01 [Fusarium sp. VM40]
MALTRKSVLCSAVCLALLVGLAYAGHEHEHVDTVAAAKLDSMSLEELDAQLQTCPIVEQLNAAKHAHHAAAPSSMTARLFAVLFPGSPAVNALLATLYISGPPNFLLALCPTNIDPASLSVMVAFAVGGLLGDTLFHLLPEIFVGEDHDEAVKFVLVEPNRNLILGLGILIGFMTFVAMDKGLRIATGGAGHDHSHGHGDAHVHSHSEDKAISSGVDATDGDVKSRKKGIEDKGAVVSNAVEQPKKEINPSVKMGGYLNLIADFTHNITDGLAMSASFYASPTIGATTTVAVFFHEIPHEVGDFALLIQSGFSKRAAMGSQFITALGALLGTLIGIAVQEFGGPSSSDAPMGRHEGIWGTSLSWGDMLLPFTAGTFLYVGTVAVIPELLETGPNKAKELKNMIVQFSAVAVGAGIMLYISWHD